MLVPAAGNKPAEIPGTLELGVEPGQTAVDGSDKDSSGIREINQVIVSSEDVEAQFRFDFPDLPANGGLHNVNTFRGPAKMQFARDSQDVFQFTEWGSCTHDVTAPSGMALQGR